MQSCLNTKMYTFQPTNIKKNKKTIEIGGNSKTLTSQSHTVFFIETHTVYWEFTSTNPLWDKGFICLSNEENDLYGTKTRVTIRRKDPWADLEGGGHDPHGKRKYASNPLPSANTYRYILRTTPPLAGKFFWIRAWDPNVFRVLMHVEIFG